MKKSEQGAGLIEVLVALLVTAIGLLGVLAAQATGIQSNQRAEFITEAHLLASDMVNMIIAHNAYGDPSSGYFVNLTADKNLQSVDCSGGCSRVKQYEHDRAEWSSQLQNILPSGYGTVTFDAATEMFTVTVMWDEERNGVTGTSCGGNPKVDLTCYALEVQI